MTLSFDSVPSSRASSPPQRTIDNAVATSSRDRATEVDLAAAPDSVPAARHAAEDTLRRWAIPETTAQDAILIISELVTNAVCYGAAPIHLRLAVTGQELVIEVEDAGAGMPQALRPTHEELRGRGLQLVSALSSRWGVRKLTPGKTVGSALAL